MATISDTAAPSPAPKARLEECVTRLAAGPWRFVQLRGEALGPSAIDGDDVDLLGSRDSVTQLLAAAFAWVRAGDCHLRLHSANRAKTAFALYSTDGKHRVDFDLWIELWQFHNRTRCLRYANCAGRVMNPNESLQRLPLELEAAIYVQHLIAKRKDLGSAKVADRLASYVSRCPRLTELLSPIPSAREVSAATRNWAEQLVEKELAVNAPRFGELRWRKVRDALRTAWFAPPHKLKILALLGCDGSGKTSLARELATRRSDIAGVLTGKHLYRKSWFYKLLVIFVRPLLFQNREHFDETMAPVAYVRACLGLQFQLWRRVPGIRLMDRSLADFVFVGRKTEQPRFGRSRWLTRVLGRRIPTVHLVLPYECVQARKQEMTRVGHEAYDREMFRHFSRQTPVEYFAFNNAGSLEEGAAALDRIVTSLDERD